MLDGEFQERVRHYLSTEVAALIVDNRNVSLAEGLRLFLVSEIYMMLCDPELAMWEFSPLAIYDMWENEIQTGDPRNSLYLRADEIG